MLLTGLAIVPPLNGLLGVVGLAPLPSAALPGQGEVELISVSTAGTTSNGSLMGGGSVTNDGRFVVFPSNSNNLVAGDGNGRDDFFIRDTVLGTTSLLGVSSTGGFPTGGRAYGGTITPDGRFALYASDASNIVTPDANGTWTDMFVRDRQTGVTTRESIWPSGIQADMSTSGDISDNGRYVSFTASVVSGVNNNTFVDWRPYVRDRIAGTTIQIDKSTTGAWGNGVSHPVDMSRDGRFVVLASAATNLVPGDTNAAHDVFLVDTVFNTIERVSVSASEAQLTTGTRGWEAEVSDDGRFIAFTSDASNVTSVSTPANVAQVYIRDRLLQDTFLVTTRNGLVANADSEQLNMTPDGRTLVFHSNASNLLRANQVHVYDRTLGRLSLAVPPPNGTWGSGDYTRHGYPSANGDYLAFTGRVANLVPHSMNVAGDVFLTRIQTTVPTWEPVGGAPTPSEDLGGCVNPSQPRSTSPCSTPNATNYPVTVSTGNFWHTFADIAVPGRGTGLTFARTYNSLASSVDGPLGYGWSFTYGVSLTQAVDGTVTVTQENGSTVTFTPSAGGYSAPPRVQAALTANANGTWSLQRRAREQLAFDAGGRLTSVSDRNGVATTLSYTNGRLTTVTEPGGRALTLTYTGSRVTQVSDTAGRSMSFEYGDGQGNLTAATDVGGGVTRFTYDAQHRLLTMLDPEQAASANPVPVTNHYASDGRIDWQTDQLARKTSFAYGVNSTFVTDPAGNVTGYWFENGVAAIVTVGYGSADAATTRYTYDLETLAPTRVVDPMGNATIFTYDDRGNRLTSTDPLERTASWTYNSSNDVTTATDPEQVTTTFTYNAAGNLESSSTPLAGSSPLQHSVVTYTYGDPAHPADVTKVTDPNGKQWHAEYDSYGNLVASVDPLGNRTTFSYDLAGRRSTRVSPRGNKPGGNAADFTTTWGYNAFGDVLSVDDALNHRLVTRTYDKNRRLKTTMDAQGNTTTNSYDLVGQLRTISRPGGSTVQFEYNALGHQIRALNGASVPTVYGHANPAYPHLVTSTTDGSNRVTTFGFDRAGRNIWKQTPNGNCAATPKSGCTTYSYDAAGQLAALAYSDGVTPNVTNITYDDNGRKLTSTDGTGTSSWSYDSFGQLTSSTDGSGDTVGYSYDIGGRLTAIDYPNSRGRVTRGYDDAGRLTTVTDWNSNSSTFTYDEDGNVTSEIYPNGTTATASIDRGQRVSSLSHAPTSAPNSPFATFGYGRDNGNQVVTATDGGTLFSGQRAYGYSPLNQLSTVNGGGYRYDAADNLQQFPDGRVQAYDQADQLQGTTNISYVGATSAGESGLSTSVTAQVPAGTTTNDQLLVAVTLPNGQSVSTPAGYTLVGSYSSGSGGTSAKVVVFRRTAVAGDTSVTVSSTKKFAKAMTVLSYRGVDPTFPIGMAIASGVNGSTTVTAPMAFNALVGDRAVVLTGATSLSTASTWTAPPGMSMRTQTTGGSTVAASASDETIYSSPGPRTATISSSGNLVGVSISLLGVRSPFQYDGQGNRTSVTTPTMSATMGYDQVNRMTSYTSGAVSAGYAYDGDGRRASKTVSGVSTQFVWEDVTGKQALLTEGATSYVYGPGAKPIAQITPSGTMWFHRDQLGSTRVLTNSSGQAVATFSYDVHGNLTSKTGSADTAIRYAGEYRDSETGLIYLRARYYDPVTAQFTSRDPLESITRSAYGYVGNNPVNRVDPLGLDWWDPRDWDQDVVGALEDGVGAVAEVADDTWDASGGRVVSWVADNPGLVATIGAIGVCLIPAVGLVGCGIATGLAFGVRAYERIDEYGFKESLLPNAVDGFLTYATFGMVSAVGSAAAGKGGALAAGEVGLMTGAPAWQHAMAKAGYAMPDVLGLVGTLLC
jgi:RHS repeat-associated protein